MSIFRLWTFAALFSSQFVFSDVQHEKVLICGIGQNIEKALFSTISNIESLGSLFGDYRVIVYENNSDDGTVDVLNAWAAYNSHVICLSEYLSPQEQPSTRTEKIARARNRVLAVARRDEYADFKYLIMADLDLPSVWPIEEIVKTIESPKEWDCVCVNGIGLLCPEGHGPHCVTANGWVPHTKQVHCDRYAFRNKDFPFGPELLGDSRWAEDLTNRVVYDLHCEEWQPVYSAFGGLAIYKTETILKFAYSGVATDDVRKYYEKIAGLVSPANPQLSDYLEMHNEWPKTPIQFVEKYREANSQSYVPICEHMALHASMAVEGYDKIFVNPKMVLIVY